MPPQEGGTARSCLEPRSRILHLMEREMILRVEGLKKIFRSGESDLMLFENLSFQVARGELLAIVGESGSGKSTLLHILGALDRASAGDVYCAHLRLSSLSEDDAAGFRNHELGFVWQFHYLLPEFTALENVAMPLLLRGSPTQDSRTADSVFELIARLHRDYQLTSLIATHNFAFARRCHRVLRLQSGRIEEVAPEALSG